MEIPGILTYDQLRAEGYTRARIRGLLAERRAVRVARGWYALEGADPRVVRALALDGKLGCLSGCALHGVWTPYDPDLHVVFPERPPGVAPGIRVHTGGRTPGPVWPLPDCLDQVIAHHDPETALIVLESAIHLRRITEEEAAALLGRHGRSARRLVKHLDAAESGSETRVRYFLRRRRVGVSSQVWVTPHDRVDLRVGKSLVLECDSAAHHSSQSSYEADRERDTRLRALGYDVWRLSYRQIWMQWEATQLDLLHEIARRRHANPPHPR